MIPAFLSRSELYTDKSGSVPQHKIDDKCQLVSLKPKIIVLHVEPGLRSTAVFLSTVALLWPLQRNICKGPSLLQDTHHQFQSTIRNM